MMMIIRLSGFVQVNTHFFIRKGEDCFEEVKGKKIKIQGFEEFDFFAHKVKKGELTFWAVSDGISGMRIGKLNKSLKKCIDRSDRLLSKIGKNRVEFLIREKIGYKIISPRYRFVANPNSIMYVATEKHKNRKSVFPRKYRVRVREE